MPNNTQPLFDVATNEYSALTMTSHTTVAGMPTSNGINIGDKHFVTDGTNITEIWAWDGTAWNTLVTGGGTTTINPAIIVDEDGRTLTIDPNSAAGVTNTIHRTLHVGSGHLGALLGVSGMDSETNGINGVTTNHTQVVIGVADATISSANSVIAGGESGFIDGQNGGVNQFIGGGLGGYTAGNQSVALGGTFLSVESENGAALGGNGNQLLDTDTNSAVAGGENIFSNGNVVSSFMGGGSQHDLENMTNSGVLGGSQLEMLNVTNALNLGGSENVLEDSVNGGTIGGELSFTTGNRNFTIGGQGHFTNGGGAPSEDNIIGGGDSNFIGESLRGFSFGGQFNSTGNFPGTINSGALGGTQLEVDGTNSVGLGGQSCQIEGTDILVGGSNQVSVAAAVVNGSAISSTNGQINGGNTVAILSSTNARIDLGTRIGIVSTNTSRINGGTNIFSGGCNDVLVNEGTNVGFIGMNGGLSNGFSAAGTVTNCAAIGGDTMNFANANNCAGAGVQEVSIEDSNQAFIGGTGSSILGANFAAVIACENATISTTTIKNHILVGSSTQVIGSSGANTDFNHLTILGTNGLNSSNISNSAHVSVIGCNDVRLIADTITANQFTAIGSEMVRAGQTPFAGDGNVDFSVVLGCRGTNNILHANSSLISMQDGTSVLDGQLHTDRLYVTPTIRDMATTPANPATITTGEIFFFDAGFDPNSLVNGRYTVAWRYQGL